MENLLNRVSAPERDNIKRNDHLSIAGIRWIDTKTSLVKIWRHDSDKRKGFERFYRYSLP